MPLIDLTGVGEESLKLINKYNIDELKLLIEGLQFYINTYDVNKE